MANQRIDVVNRSTVLTDAQIQEACNDIQWQISRDFAPKWIIGAQLNFIPKNKPIPAGGWQMIILDTADVANALGYHELTSQGMPLGKVFAKTAIQDGASWTVTLSHEILEMLADPDTNLFAFNQDSISARMYAYEVCDPVEDDSFGYRINNTLVSDFVLPEWFEGFWAANTTQFDQTNQTNMPLSIKKNGYITYLDIGNPVWKTIQKDGAKPFNQQTAKSKDRLDKRQIPRTQWRKSNPK